MQKSRILDYGLSFACLLMAISFSIRMAQATQAVSYPQYKLAQKKISFCGHEYLAWVARSDEERSRGLMSFRELKKHEAMLFEFPDEDLRSFWMKNAAYDLDIAFFSREKKYVSHLTMKASSPLVKEHRLPHYESEGPAQFAVEVKAGSLGKIPSNCRLSIH